jgi:hypothetical protein
MSDTFTVRMVVVFLGAAVILSLAGGFYLAAKAVTVPDYLIAIGSGSLGALGALLARTDNRVTIDQKDNDPVPVAEVNEPADAGDDH